MNPISVESSLPSFHSLRRRLILPLFIAAALAAIVVAAASYWLAAASANTDLVNRFSSIRRVVEESNFPLTRNVLVMLANLTSADWYTLNSNGEVHENATNPLGDPRSAAELQGLKTLVPADANSQPQSIQLDGRVYQAMRFASRSGPRGSSDNLTTDVVVMFDDSLRRRSLYRAAAIPLVTGLSTVLLLTSIAWFISEKLILRITRLQREVECIAQGDFQSTIQPGGNDELGLLSNSVRSMGEQLNQMWHALRQRHGQQLLHQISGGLAHNLRNTLTGARMAVELVQRKLNSGQATGSNESNADNVGSEANGLSVAVSQLEQAEAYVQRMLLASRGQEARNRPASIRDSLEGVRAGLQSTAEHRGVRLEWDYAESLRSQQVADAPTLLAAVSNLVWNAMEAGKDVRVGVSVDDAGRCAVSVSDNGPGPNAEVETSLFEPFVSSKAEGLGLGLPLVKRAAETLRGEVQWNRVDDRTVFCFKFPVVDEPQK